MNAYEAKRKYDWDHTASVMALNATIHTSGRYSRDDFHPLRERKIPEYMLDDPAAEYERLKKMGK